MSTTEPNETQTAGPPRSRLKRWWPLIVLVAVVGALIVGELALQWAKHRGWTTYTTDDGLASNTVRSIIVAPDGSVWVGTTQGVSRFDGETWTTYTEEDGLADNVITSIAKAPDGALWFGTTLDGASRFDGEMWTTYTEEDGLASDAVTSMAVAPDGALWFGTGRWEESAYVGNGVSRFDGLTWTTYTADDGLADNGVRSITVSPDGAVWFGTYGGGGASRFDGETWTTYTEDDRLAGNDIVSIAVAPDGRVWVGTWGGGVSCFADLATSTGDGGTWTTYTDSNSGLASGWVQSLDFDGQGRVWVGTADGLSVFDERMSLSVQVLQVWTIMRILGIALLVLLASVWTVRRRSMLRARLSPVIAWIPRLVCGSRAWVGAILGALAIFPGLVWWAQSLGLVDWPLFDSSLGYIVVPLAGLVLAGTGLVLSIKASGGDMKRQGIVGQVLNLLALLILAYPVCLALLWLLVVAFDIPIQ